MWNKMTKETKPQPAASRRESSIWAKNFVSWAQRFFHTCRESTGKHRFRQHHSNFVSFWYRDIPWVNQRSFLMSAMVMRASGQASNNLDNKPGQRIRMRIICLILKWMKIWMFSTHWEALVVFSSKEEGMLSSEANLNTPDSSQWVGPMEVLRKKTEAVRRLFQNIDKPQTNLLITSEFLKMPMQWSLTVFFFYPRSPS